MPSNLTDVSSFDAVSAPVGADIRNAASVRSSLQTVANRTKYLVDRHDALADIAALKAVASPADGLVRFVKAKGVYRFDIGSAAAEDLPFVVQPTVGGGRWIHELEQTRGVAGGLAKLNGSQHLIVQGVSGHPTYETPRSVTRFQPFIPFGGLHDGWLPALDEITPGVRGPGTVDDIQLVILTEVHDGATLTNIEALFVVDGGHAAVPAGLPYIEAFRMLINGGGAGSIAGLNIAGGANFPAPASVAAYEAAGVKSWSLAVDQNNVIDRSQYLYYLRIDDESGANALAGNMFLGFKLTFTTITDMRPG